MPDGGSLSDGVREPRAPTDGHRDRREDDVLAGRRCTTVLALVLVLLDVLLLAANVVNLRLQDGDPAASGSRFSLVYWNGDVDGSYVEMLGHFQLVGAAVLLLAVAVVRRSVVHAAWALTATGLLVDDFALVHELVGGWLVQALGLPGPWGLRPEDVGELLVWSGEALVLGLVVVLATVRAPAWARRDSLVLFGCVTVLAVFGVGVDQLHIVLEPHLGDGLLAVVTLVETSGELGGMTLLALAAVSMTRPSSSPGSRPPA